MTTNKQHSESWRRADRHPAAKAADARRKAGTTAVTYRKADGRYYVDLDGEQVGWVTKEHDGTWTFRCPVRHWHEGEVLARGSQTRRDAVMDGIGSLSAHHLGRVAHLSLSQVDDHWRYFDRDRLQQIWAQLLDQKYPDPR